MMRGVSAVPRVVEAGAALLLALAVHRAFFGRPPARADRVAAAGWMVAGVLLLTAAVAPGTGATPRELLAAGGVLAACAAGWWLRGAGDDGRFEPEAPSPVDWDAFDRERGTWSPRSPVT